MTATDALRALLDERGVEWWEEDGHTLWYGQSIHHAASAFSSFMFGENERVHLNAMVTPEQAVAATLGPAYEPPIAAHWDGDVLVLTTPRDPSSVHVQRAEGQPRKVYPSEATLGPGTCRAVSMRERDKRPYLHDELVCSKCGCQLAHEFGHVWQNYCPECGKRVVG